MEDAGILLLVSSASALHAVPWIDTCGRVLRSAARKYNRSDLPSTAASAVLFHVVHVVITLAHV